MSDENTRIHREKVVRSLRAQESALERYGDTVVQLLNLIFEAVRALKPAPEQLQKKLECVRVQSDARGYNLRRAQDEIDRMNQVVADQALTIGTLKDENGRLTSACDEYKRVCRDCNANEAELKRFREREEKVAALVQRAIKIRMPDDARDDWAVCSDKLYDAAVAVRDYEVTNG